MARQYLNNYSTQLIEPAFASDTTLTVGTPPPPLEAGDYYRLQLARYGLVSGVRRLVKSEFVDVTAVSDNHITVRRYDELEPIWGVDVSTPQDWGIGDLVQLVETAETFKAIPDSSSFLSEEIIRYRETIAAATTTIDRADGGIQTLTLATDSALTWVLNDGEKIQLYLTPAGFNVTDWGVTYWMTDVPTLATENMIVVEKVGGSIYAWDGGSR